MTKKALKVLSKEDQVKFICLARYHTQYPTPFSMAFNSYKSIASLLNLSATTVRNICLQQSGMFNVKDTDCGVITSKRRLPRRTPKKTFKTKLSPDHIAFLTSQSNLRKWSGHSLRERAELFNSQHAGYNMTASKLGRVYKKHGVKYKMIKFTKILNRKQKKKLKT